MIYVSASGVFIGHVRTVKTSTWWDEHLTADNVEFMKRTVSEEYRELTVARLNPLKDEPWPRHEWEERELHTASLRQFPFSACSTDVEV